MIFLEKKPVIRSLPNDWRIAHIDFWDLALLGRRFGGRLGKIVVVGHAAGYVRVEVPLHCSCGESAL